MAVVSTPPGGRSPKKRALPPNATQRLQREDSGRRPRLDEVMIDGLSGSNVVRLYDSGQLLPTTTSQALASTTVNWSQVDTVQMVYRDPNGSRFISYWRRPTQPPVPAVTGFNPTSGPPGTQVTIIGTNFGCAGCSGGIAVVRFNEASAVFTGNTNTSVTAFVPAGATTGPTSVRTLGGTGTSPSSFTVTPG